MYVLIPTMYRCCAGFCKLLEETTETTLQEKNCDRRENREMFQMKMALTLGRSISQLRKLASKSAFYYTQGADVGEFVSKLLSMISFCISVGEVKYIRWRGVLYFLLNFGSYTLLFKLGLL